VRIDLTKLEQPFTRKPAQGGIPRQSSRGALVQTQAPTRRHVVSPGGVISGRPAATLDHDSPLGAKAIEDAPECRLTDAWSYQSSKVRSPETPRFHHQKLKYLLARRRPHGLSPVCLNRL
jgi:hypothetical protein